MDIGKIHFAPAQAYVPLPNGATIPVGFDPFVRLDDGATMRHSEAGPYLKYRRYMPQAFAIANMSKESTKVGALVLGQDQEPLSSGWNGAPRGCHADADERGATREERLKWMVHAEANAIANAARTGARLKDSTMVVTHVPCIACANLVVQAGIKRVITNKPDGAFAERWREDNDRARRLFKECGVEFIEIDTIVKRA